MIHFPNCKVNLGLHITRRRDDGYHDLETVFYPIPLRDALEVITMADPSHGPLHFQSTGLPIAGDAGSNLCVKAYHLLKKDFPSLPPVQVHLHKAIPMGAGLGGGSSDGAAMLHLLNEKYRLNLSRDQLLSYALQLGSDCPFFTYNTPCHALGRGEILEPLALDLSGYEFVLVNPGVHVSTALAFSQIVPHEPPRSLKEIVQLPVESWKESLVNDFEIPVSQAHPVITKIKAELYEQGAVYASMTGSGSTVYAMFKRGALPEAGLQSSGKVYYTK